MPSEALPIPRALSLHEVRGVDLTRSPPDGFPKLSHKQAAFVQAIADAPNAGTVALCRSAGLPTRTSVVRMPSVVVYRRAIELGLTDQDDGEASRSVLRGEAVDRLRRVIRAGADRDAIGAAKILDGLMRADQNQRLVAVADIPTPDLWQRLGEALSVLEGSGPTCHVGVSVDESGTYSLAPLPDGGRGADDGPVIDVAPA